MIGPFECIGQRENTFETKRGTRVVQQILALIDVSDRPLIITVDYILSEEEEKEYSGKLLRKRISLEIDNIAPDFGGRIVLKGRIQGKPSNNDK